MRMGMIMQVGRLGGAGGGGSGSGSLGALLENMTRAASRLTEQMGRYTTNEALFKRTGGDLTPIGRRVGSYDVVFSPTSLVYAMRGAYRVVTQEAPDLRTALESFENRWRRGTAIEYYEPEEVLSRLETIRDTLQRAEEFLRLKTPPPELSNDMVEAGNAAANELLNLSGSDPAKGLAQRARLFRPDPKKRPKKS